MENNSYETSIDGLPIVKVSFNKYYNVVQIYVDNDNYELSCALCNDVPLKKWIDLQRNKKMDDELIKNIANSVLVRLNILKRAGSLLYIDNKWKIYDYYEDIDS